MDLRQRTRRAVQADIGEAAVTLFLEHGFEAVTMDQIAAAAGISRRSLFRYFAGKEDIVLGDLIEAGRAAREVLEAQPPQDPPWTALKAAFKALADAPDGRPERAMRVARMIYDTPALHAAHLEKQLRWQALLVPDVERRLGITGGEGRDPRARAIVAAALICLDLAVQEWSRLGGHGDVEKLYDDAVAAVRG